MRLRAAWIVLGGALACAPPARVEAPTQARAASPPIAPVSEPARAPPPKSAAVGADELGEIFPWPPEVVATTPIALAVSPAPFVAAGCVETSGGAALDCGKARGFPAGECRFGVKKDDALGPLGAIYECWTTDVPPAPGMFHAGGLADAVLAFLAIDKGAVVVVRDQVDFVHCFGPADTPEKALAFAVAFTNARPDFAPRPPPQEYRVYTPRIEGTRVVAAGDAWDVSLFSSVVFGCGTHPALAVDVHVARAGDVSIVRSRALWADPRRRVCVD